MSRSSRPPVDRETVHELNQPNARDRDRIRENVDRSLARGSASPTVLRVDASMAQRALGSGAASTSLVGSKLAIAKLLIPALLIGAGVGAIWARTLFVHSARSEQENRSLPVDVEELGPLDTMVGPDFSAPDPSAFAANDPATTARDALRQANAAHAKPSARAPRANHASHAEHSSRHSHTTGNEAAPPLAAAPMPALEPVPEAATHHLAEELRLMRAASGALAAQDIQRTLNVLSQHAERFPDGSLREERRALRVISLCKQGHSHFALAERDEFLSSSPRSPLTARVREACESPQ